MANRATKWYKGITKEDAVGPITKMKKLTTAEVFKSRTRKVLSRITQLRTDNGDIGEYL